MCEDDWTSTGASFLDGIISLRRIHNVLQWVFFHFSSGLSSSCLVFHERAQPRCRSTAAATGQWPGAKVFSDRNDAVVKTFKFGLRNLKRRRRLRTFESFIALERSRNRFHHLIGSRMTLSLNSEDFLVETHVPPRPGPLSVKPRMVKPLVRLRRPGRVLSAQKKSVSNCRIAYDEINTLETNGLCPQHLVKTATWKSNSWCQCSAISGYVDYDNVQVGWAEAARDPQL